MLPLLPLLHQPVLRTPVQLRMVFALHDMEELGTDQVAQILGLHPGTDRIRPHRAPLRAQGNEQGAGGRNREGECQKAHKVRFQGRFFQTRPATSRMPRIISEPV